MSAPDLPSQDHFRDLDRWALIAYAARCARRAFPFTTEWPEGREAAERYVLGAEYTAQTRPSRPHTEELIFCEGDPDPFKEPIARVGVQSARSAATAWLAARAENASTRLALVYAAIHHSVDAHVRLKIPRSAVRSALNRDFDRLILFRLCSPESGVPAGIFTDRGWLFFPRGDDRDDPENSPARLR
ncbi:MAG: hypothetical protein AAF517_27825 [Planctomycetota bacterium]